MRSEADISNGKVCAEVVTDITKLFDSIGHSKLVGLLHKVGYPLPILRMSLWMYRQPRRLLFEGNVVGPPLTPSRSIAAGGVFAVFEVAGFVDQALEKASAICPQVGFSIHVDDLTMRSSEPEVCDTVNNIVEAAAYVKEQFEGDLQVSFSIPKTAVIASSAEVGKQIVRRLGLPHSCFGPSLRKLGVDVQLQRGKQHKPTRKMRQQKFLKRVQLCKRLRVAGAGKGRKVFVSGLLPAVTYGCELEILSPDLTRRVRVQALRASGTYVPGGDTDLNLALHVPGYDPLCKMCELALERYHREWWFVRSGNAPQDALSSHELIKAFAWAHKYCEDHMPEVEKAKSWPPGPLGAVLRAVAAVRWCWVSPTVLEAEQGDQLDLLAGSPAMLK